MVTSKLFSEAMGELDEKYLTETLEYKPKKRQNFTRYLALVAVLCLVVAVTVWANWGDSGLSVNESSFPIGTEYEDDTVESVDNSMAESGDLVPMVCVNGMLYQCAGNQPDLTGKEDEFVFLGEIQSQVDTSQEPTNDFQANDDIIGAKVYQYGDDIVVLIDGQYWLYEAIE